MPETVANRLLRLESLAGGSACWACGEGDIAPDAQVVLGKINLDAEPVPSTPAAPCFVCGRVPVAARFGRITFDGDKLVTR